MIFDNVSDLRCTKMREATPNKAGGWHNVMITSVQNPALKRHQGRLVPEISRDLVGIDELDILFDLLRSDHARTTMILFLMDDRDVSLVLDHGSAVIGSDQLGVTAPDASVHPRAYGTFAHVLERAAKKGEMALGRHHRTK